MDLNKLETVINNSLRKTINRFRERPLYFFTESDIHSSLQGDLLDGNSEYFYFDKKVSLVHLEYPTNFRYEKKQLLEGYSYNNENCLEHETSFLGKYGDRGNYDLAILDRNFVDISLTIKKHLGIKQIINKDILTLGNRLKEECYGLTKIQKEVLYAIEVKFIHQFNARNKNMLEEVIKDNEKLKLSLYHSNGFIRPINLIFCSSKFMKRRDNKSAIIDRVRDYIKTGEVILTSGITKQIPHGVVNIFIESYFDDESIKTTPKPIIFCSQPQDWAFELANTLGVKFI